MKHLVAACLLCARWCSPEYAPTVCEWVVLTDEQRCGHCLYSAYTRVPTQPENVDPVRHPIAALLARCSPHPPLAFPRVLPLPRLLLPSPCLLLPFPRLLPACCSPPLSCCFRFRTRLSPRAPHSQRWGVFWPLQANPDRLRCPTHRRQVPWLHAAQTAGEVASSPKPPTTLHTCECLSNPANPLRITS